jgi:hypothetical protein
MKIVLAILASCLFFSCTQVAESQEVEAAFQGFPVTQLHKSKYKMKNNMTAKQRRAFETERRWVGSVRSARERVVKLHANTGRAVKAEALPLKLTSTDASMLKKYRAGLLSYNQTEAFSSSVSRRIKEINDAVDREWRAADAEWRRNNPELAAERQRKQAAINLEWRIKKLERQNRDRENNEALSPWSPRF